MYDTKKKDSECSSKLGHTQHGTHGLTLIEPHVRHVSPNCDANQGYLGGSTRGESLLGSGGARRGYPWGIEAGIEAGIVDGIGVGIIAGSFGGIIVGEVRPKATEKQYDVEYRAVQPRCVFVGANPRPKQKHTHTHAHKYASFNHPSIHAPGFKICLPVRSL